MLRFELPTDNAGLEHLSDQNGSDLNDSDCLSCHSRLVIIASLSAGVNINILVAKTECLLYNRTQNQQG